jgi:ribosome-binding protein aMBF1 (putative translation factor)
MDQGTAESELVIDEDYSDEASTFGDRLVCAREAMGMDQSQLAHRLGIKHQTLRNWEEDRAEPRANKLQMLAGMLNVSMVWMMSGQGEAPVQPVAGTTDVILRSCIAELRVLRSEQSALAERMARTEKRLRALVG